jgi:hypothetical protein
MPPEHEPLVLEEYQLTMGHVVTHPELEHALHDAAVAAASLDERPEYIDLLPWLERRGFVLPPGSTARLRLPATDDPDEPPDILVCIGIGGHSFCAEWHPPIVIDISGG